MGCWDETCCLSSLPVRSGDPAVMVVIKPEHKNPQVSYSFGNHFWDYAQVQEIHKGT